jgi:hypothetical protein
MNEMKLPPYGKLFEPVPRSGIRVVVGPDAWKFTEQHGLPIMVLPEENQPSDFRWPSDKRPALVFEWGTYDDERLTAMALALLTAGASSVVALRQALMNSDPRVFFDAEDVRNVA